jgi:hypothetical protein
VAAAPVAERAARTFETHLAQRGTDLIAHHLVVTNHDPHLLRADGLVRHSEIVAPV